MSENAPKLTCPVCGKEFQREDMTFTRDCHGITFRLVCFDCYDGAYYSEADECIEEDY
nr:MAG: zinc-ribbon domain protein [Bacteriophage sp.]